MKAPESVEVPDNEEDAARAAILDKVMKGRQPADLMLRCKSMPILFTYSGSIPSQVPSSIPKVTNISQKRSRNSSDWL